jgi:hypothetical protein
LQSADVTVWIIRLAPHSIYSYIDKTWTWTWTQLILRTMDVYVFTASSLPRTHMLVQYRTLAVSVWLYDLYVKTTTQTVFRLLMVSIIYIYGYHVGLCS